MSIGEFVVASVAALVAMFVAVSLLFLLVWSLGEQDEGFEEENDK